MAQVLCVGNLHSPDVHYSYSVPVERQAQRYLWDPSGPWLDCSHKCQGKKNSIVIIIIIYIALFIRGMQPKVLRI